MTEADVLAALRGYWLEAAPPLLGPVAQLLFDDDDRPEGVVDHVVVRLASAGNTRVTIGRRREENRGTIFCQVFSDPVGGPGPGERLASAVASLWRPARLARITLTAPSVAGLTSEGGFNRHLVTLGWRADLRFSDQGN